MRDVSQTRNLDSFRMPLRAIKHIIELPACLQISAEPDRDLDADPVRCVRSWSEARPVIS